MCWELASSNGIWMHSYQKRNLHEVLHGDTRGWWQLVIKGGLVLAGLELMAHCSGEAEKNTCAEYISWTQSRKSQGTNRDDCKSCNCLWGITAVLLIRTCALTPKECNNKLLVSSWGQGGFTIWKESFWAAELAVLNIENGQKILCALRLKTKQNKTKADLGQTKTPSFGISEIFQHLSLVMNSFRNKSLDSQTGRRNYPSLPSAQVAGILTEDVGEPVHIPALPEGFWTHIFTRGWYKVEELFLPSWGKGGSSLYFQSFSAGKPWKKSNIKTFWKEQIRNALLPSQFQWHFWQSSLLSLFIPSIF